MFNGGNSKFRFGYFLSSALTLLVIEVTLFIVGREEPSPTCLGQKAMLLLLLLWREDPRLQTKATQFPASSNGSVTRRYRRRPSVSRKSLEVKDQGQFTRGCLVTKGLSQLRS
jgi:hypothetical protein